MEPPFIDILKIPFKINGKKEIDTFKAENHYEIRLIPKIDGKKLISDCLNTKKRYLLIDDNQIIANSAGVYEFNTPYDFVISQKSSSYEQFFSYMMNEGSENTAYQDCFSENSIFESYAPPLLSNNQLFENYDFKNIKTKLQNRKMKPNKTSEEEKLNLKNKLIELHGEIEFNTSLSMLDKVFCEKKIIRWKHTNFYHGNLNKNQIKKYLPLFASFKHSGPWRKSWIKLGFDPNTDYSSFKMQRIRLNHGGKEICLIDHPFLIHELEQNKKNYLKEIADDNGFLTQDGIDFINLHFDRSIVPDSIKNTETDFLHQHNESSEGSDFSLIDE